MQIYREERVNALNAVAARIDGNDNTRSSSWVCAATNATKWMKRKRGAGVTAVIMTAGRRCVREHIACSYVTVMKTQPP
jgi:hypothetical protein